MISRVFAGLLDVGTLLADDEGLDERELFYRDFYAALYIESCPGATKGASQEGRHNGSSEWQEARHVMLRARSGKYFSGAGAEADYMCSACAMHCAVRGWTEAT